MVLSTVIGQGSGVIAPRPSERQEVAAVRNAQARGTVDRVDVRPAPAASGIFGLASTVTQAVQAKYGKKPQVLGYGSARANLIGEHVDNFGGKNIATKSIPFAIDKQIVLAAFKNRSRSVELTSLNFDKTIRFNLDDIRKPGFELDTSSWARFPQAMALELMERGHRLGGISGSLIGNVPGKGTSSSAALCVCLAETFNDLFKLGMNADDIVEVARAAERRTGVPCGYMDQMASVHGRPGEAVVVRFFREGKPEFERIPMDLGRNQIVGIDTGKERDLLTLQYGQRVKECEAALTILEGILPEITALSEITPELFAKYGNVQTLGTETLVKRVRHIVTEMIRTEDVERILKSEAPNKAELIGKILTECHESLKNDFEVSCPELDFLVKTAIANGAWGARLMGAGEGGNMIFLGPDDKAQEILQKTLAAYSAEFPERKSGSFECNPSIGGGVIPLERQRGRSARV